MLDTLHFLDISFYQFCHLFQFMTGRNFHNRTASLCGVSEEEEKQVELGRGKRWTWGSHRRGISDPTGSSEAGKTTKIWWKLARWEWNTHTIASTSPLIQTTRGKGAWHWVKAIPRDSKLLPVTHRAAGEISASILKVDLVAQHGLLHIVSLSQLSQSYLDHF